ncbi:MAG: mannitol dehydrogenase family protein [Solobacterium sp.]|nr:mannitol dehydrogenase family protein [Solobacterium sp.]
MKLTFAGIKDREAFAQADIRLPGYDPEVLAEKTRQNPVWVHFGIGNIFRVFNGSIADQLVENGLMESGITCVESFDYEVLDKIYTPYDNLSLNVILHADGTVDRKVIGVFGEAVRADASCPECWKRLKEIFRSPTLQMVTFTITEKGYALKDENGAYYPFVLKDIEQGPATVSSVPAILAAMLKERFEAGGTPLALVSMDNCSRNGETLRNAVLEVAGEWYRQGKVTPEYMSFISDEDQVSFPWTMIDKITPRPSEEIAGDLEARGLENMMPVVTSKHTFIAPFVNAEGPQYLVVEDRFPNGRPPLENAGVYMTDRETVNKSERMKVTVCLNPVHTALTTYDCLLGYEYFADGMFDPELAELARRVSYVEGMDVVPDPEILSPTEFLDELFTERFPNKYLGDTSQRISVDISQMVGIRFGETIKAYVQKYGTAEKLVALPLAITGWLRYMLAVDDQGNAFELAPDPRGKEIWDYMQKNFRLGHPEEVGEKLKPVLSNANIFGSDLYESGIGSKIEEMFREEIEGPGAVREVLKKYLWGKETFTGKMREQVTNIQHLGLPTDHFIETLAFYEGLGFTIDWKATDRECAFLRLNEVVIETYTSDQVHPVWGAWDHIAMNVRDIDKVYEAVKAAGYTFAEGEDGPVYLPYYANGVKFFTIVGPNNEKLEFNQIL